MPSFSPHNALTNGIRGIAILAMLLAGFALAAQPAHAQDQPPVTPPSETARSSADLVDLEPLTEATGVLPGESVQAAVLLHIADGWHVNANQPIQDFLIGTNLDFQTHSQLIVAETVYPDPEHYEFGFAGDDELAVLKGAAPIFLSVRVDDAAEPGTHTLEGSLRVQACDDEVCLAPSTMDVELPVEVVANEDQIEAQHEALFDEYEPFATTGAASIRSENEIAALFSERGFLLAFGAIFLIGLALNLTPCVYPMMSVTVALFGGQQQDRTMQSFGRASLYVGGIVAMYSVLGVAAAYTGSLFGAWLQSPFVLGTIGLLLLLLALSMFGMYELKLPASWQNRLGAAQNASGPSGFFFSGLLVGVFAAPCIGPPVIALLAFVGSQGDPLFGFLIFAIMALGLGLPYLILGTFTGLMHKMPNSGTWMVWVKKVFGVVLVGAALFYLGLAIEPSLAPYAVPLTLVGGGIYLAFDRTVFDNSLFRWFAHALAGAAVVAGIFAFMQLQQPGVDWTPYSPEAVETAQAEGQPVLMDFYADWCIPCIELDRVTFTDAGVQASLEEYKTIKVDLTAMGSEEAEAVREKYNVSGVPTLIFLDENGQEVESERIVGFLGPSAMIERIEQVDSHRGVADASQ